MARGIQLYSKLSNDDEEEKEKEKDLSVFDLALILKPYFWPDEGTDGAVINRCRSSATWLMVSLSKTCSLLAPLYLATATNELVDGNLSRAIRDVCIYSFLRFFSSFFKGTAQSLLYVFDLRLEMQSIVYLKVKQQANIQLAVQAFSHLHKLSLNWHLSKKMGNVIRSLDRGTGAADTLITYLFLYLLPALLECIAVCIVFLVKFHDVGISAVALGGVVVYSLITVIITRWRKKFRSVYVAAVLFDISREASNKHDNEYHDKATDSIINYETVKYFTAENYEVNRFRESVAKYQQFSVVTQASMGFLNCMQQLIINITVLGAMVLAAKNVVHGKMSIGDFVAVNAYTMSMFAPLSFLGSIYSAIVQGLIDVKNLIGLITESPDIVDQSLEPIPLQSYTCHECNRSVHREWKFCPHCGKEVSAQSAIQHGVSVEFENISFHYPGQPADKGLKNISFYVSPGTTTAIVGHTGSGKTTISRMLFRFYDPYAGMVKLGSYDIKKYTQKSVRGSIGIVPQDTVLFNDTILHNIKYGNMDATFEEVQAAAEAAQILSFIENLPEKWETVVGERGLKLSGGEKQRVAIARCLLKNPPVVLLDEATSALDTITERSVQDALNALGQNRTVIVIAHRLSTVKRADQIIVLDEGNVVEKGTHDELLIRNGRYSDLWNEQFRDDERSDTSPTQVDDKILYDI